MDAHTGLAQGQRSPARAWGLVAGQDDHVAVIGQVQAQVVQHPPAGGHATGRQNHFGAMALGQGFGVLHALDHHRHVLHGLHLGRAQAVPIGVVAKQIGGVDRHGAVQVNRQMVRHQALRLQGGDGVQDGLRPAHRKHRNHHHAGSGSGTLQSGGQLGQSVFVRVDPVAIGGLDQHRVGRWRVLRWLHDQVIGAAQIAAEQNAPLADFEQQTAGAQNVPGRTEGGAPAWHG